MNNKNRRRVLLHSQCGWALAARRGHRVGWFPCVRGAVSSILQYKHNSVPRGILGKGGYYNQRCQDTLPTEIL